MKSVTNEILNQVKHQVWNKVYDQVKVQAWNQVWYKVSTNISLINFITQNSVTQTLDIRSKL